MEVRFCRRCGAKLESKGHGAYHCANGHTIYQKASPAAGALLLNNRQEVLLSVRGIEPDKDMLDTPGGFCDPDESLLEALSRELQEEVGLKPSDYSELKYLTDAVNIYDYQGEATKANHVVFWGYLKDGAEITVGDDVTGVEWIPLKDVDINRISVNAESDRKAIKALQKIFGL